MLLLPKFRTLALLTALGIAQVGAAPKSSDYFSNGELRSLAEAGKKGDLKEIDRLLAKGADVNAEGAGRMTAVMWAVLHLNKKGFEYLLQKGANPNIPTETGKLSERAGVRIASSATAVAAQLSDPWYLQTVLKYGADPNIPDLKNRRTPIFESIALFDRRRPKEAESRVSQVKMLIAAGANLDAQDRDGYTPMMLAAIAIRYDIVHVLLEAGADPEVKNNAGTTFLSKIGSARIDKKSTLFEWRAKVIDLLQNRGFDITDDMPRLEGRWQVVSQTEDGVEIANPPSYYEFSNFELKVLGQDQRPQESWGINLDLWARPKEMEMLSQQRRSWVTYDLNGDTLRLSSLEKGRSVHPSQPHDRRSIVVVLRRADAK